MSTTAPNWRIERQRRDHAQLLAPFALKLPSQLGIVGAPHLKRKIRQQVERLRRKRLRHTLKRAARAKLRRSIKQHRNLGRGGKTALLEMLRSRFRGQNKAYWEPAENAWVIKIPSVFSFKENWGESLDVIYSVVQISTVKERRRLIFDHSDCVEISVGASMVLDIVTLELRREWAASGQTSIIGGRLPTDERTRNHLMCTGLTKQLKVRGAEAPREAEARYVMTGLISGDASTSCKLSGSSDQEKKATELALHLDKCFRRAAGYKLTRKGLREIVRWAGELIANAEEHSGRSEWFAISYMTDADPTARADYAPENAEVYCCQLAIVGFGKSIYESLSDPNTPEQTREQIETLATELSRRSLIGRALGFTKEDLTTLYALQDGVSRFNERPGRDSNSRGSGTITMIDAFQSLGNSVNPSFNPEMVLLSGGTRIFFDKEYRLVQDPNGRWIIAFNKENDLSKRPDRGHVHSIQGFFPGTLLSLRFFIDKRHLDRFIAPVDKRIESE